MLNHMAAIPILFVYQSFFCRTDYPERYFGNNICHTAQKCMERMVVDANWGSNRPYNGYLLTALTFAGNDCIDTNNQYMGILQRFYEYPFIFFTETLYLLSLVDSIDCRYTDYTDFNNHIGQHNSRIYQYYLLDRIGDHLGRTFVYLAIICLLEQPGEG